MAIQVQLRRGTTAQHNSFTGATAEVTVDTSLNTLRVHDGSTSGGFSLAKTNDLTTANVSEVTNLYFTNARARAAISVSGDLSYDASTGVISFTNDAGDIESVAAGDGLTGGGVSGDVTLNVGSGYGITVSSDGVEVNNSEITALVTKTLVDGLGVDASTLDGIDSTAFALDTDLTTANVSEVTNLYFTAARAIDALASNTVSIGELTITGNLFVQGDTVEFNTATLTIEDKTVLLANGSPNAAAANGAGIEVDGSSANLIYLSTGDKWAFNKSLNVDGEIDATGNVTSPFFYSESDIALKENVEPISGALEKVLGLLGVSFVWRNSKQDGIGVIAQNVEEVIPQAVSTSKAGYKTVSYDSLVPLLIEAVKEQQKQINYLKSKIK